VRVSTRGNSVGARRRIRTGGTCVAIVSVLAIASFGSPAAFASSGSAGLPRAGAARTVPAGRAVTQPQVKAANSYSDSVLADKPDRFYRLDQTGGRVAKDSSSHRVNGKYSSGVVYKEPGPLASDPSATGVDPSPSAGAMSAVDRGLPAGSSPVTLEAWVHDLGCCNGGGIISYGDLQGGHGFSLSVTAGITAVAFTVTGDGSKVVNFAPGITFGDGTSKWHLLDVTESGGIVTMFEDGQLIGTAHLALSTRLSRQGLDVGVGDNGLYLADAAVYPSALDAAAIDRHWTLGSSPSATACQAKPQRSAYSSAVLGDHPSVYYRLDTYSSSRVAYDSSGHCDNGAYADDAVATPGPLASGPAPGLEAESAPAAIASDTGLPAGSSPRTIEAWVHDPGCCNGGNVVSYGDVAGKRGFALSIVGGITAVQFSVTGDGGKTALFSPAIEFGDGTAKWHQLDVTFDRSTVSMYEDGQRIGTAPLVVDTVAPGTGLQIGGIGLSIADVAIFPSALSPEQIDHHWSTASSPTGSGCHADATTTTYDKSVLADHPSLYYSLSDLSESRVAYDSSGHCDNGAYADDSVAHPGPLAGVSRDGMTSGASPAVIASDAGLPSGSSALTLEAWVHDPDCCAGGNLISYGDPSSKHGFGLSVTSGIVAVSFTVTGSKGDSLSFPPDIEFTDGTAKWHLLDLTFASDSVSIYEDGQDVATTKVPADTVLGGGLEIGAYPLSLADVAVYPRALTPEQVELHWVLGGSTRGSLCESSGRGVYDQSVTDAAPSVFFPLDDYSQSRVAFDASSHCDDGAYSSGVPVPGPLGTDPTAHGIEGNAGLGITVGPGPTVTANDAALPAGGSDRTIQAFVKSPNGCCVGASLVSYGDVATGQGFTVSITGGITSVDIEVTGELGSSFTASPPATRPLEDGNWHRIDVVLTDGVVEVFEDGEAIGSGPLSVETRVPGQGLQIGGYGLDIADVAVYPRALSSSEIGNQYAQSGAWELASCSLSDIGVSGCWRTAKDWAHDIISTINRPPDFIVVDESEADADFSTTVTCDGNAWTTVGAGVGVGFPASATIGIGYLGDPSSATEPSAAAVDDFMAGAQFSFSFGLGIGDQLISSNGVDGVVYFGGLVAGVSFTASYTVPAAGNEPAPSGACTHGADLSKLWQVSTNQPPQQDQWWAPPISLEQGLAGGSGIRRSATSSPTTAVAVAADGGAYLTGKGFEPGSDVVLSSQAVTSGTSKAPVPVPLGVAAADDTGAIGFNVALPRNGLQVLSATGHTTTGAPLVLRGSALVVRSGFFDSRLPSPTRSDTGVSCVHGSSDCWSVAAATGGPEILTSNDDGADWSKQSIPAGIESLAAISCGDASHCVAVGTALSKGKRVAAVLTTSDGGKRWTKRRTPVSGSKPAPPLGAVACVGADASCWATSPGSPAVLRSTTGGATWTPQQLTVPSTATFRPSSLAFPTSKVGYLVGSLSCGHPSRPCRGALYRTVDSGATWSRIRSAPVEAGTSVSCTSATSCAATGNPAAGRSAVGEIWKTANGTKWVRSASRLRSGHLAGISCVASRGVALDCWAAGERGTGSRAKGLVFHLDGARSSTPALPTDTRGLDAVSAADKDHVVVAGDVATGKAGLLAAADGG